VTLLVFREKTAAENKQFRYFQNREKPIKSQPPSVPGFPTSRLYQRQRMRLSLKRAARNPPKLRFLTGNLGQPRDLLCAFPERKSWIFSSSLPRLSRPAVERAVGGDALPVAS
jgi:hypothetical protein